jgi:DNA-binding protein H-NS
MSVELETTQEEFEVAHEIADTGRARVVEILRSTLMHLLIDHSKMFSASGGLFIVSDGERHNATDGTANSTAEQDGRRKVAVKYRDTSGNEWSGRGMTPNWLRAYEDAGRDRSEFMVSANGNDTGE